ncbi:uncharacterized protein [Aegilops tauschii subsp. strangulata]|uniref:uncharacterized protein n=1 Tax=Aegilops tauschii subsp. strangulata TaxID=200361 RepID=UPI00098ADA39|nr:uncharacterized protein LOC109769684 [Aegilops tauschii subsp. strangulata]
MDDGRGDPYRTLLREATAALLNAYYNAPGSPFLYPTTASVLDHLNGALLSSAQRVLIEGARFRRANTGGGGPAGRTKLPCDFTPCAATNTTSHGRSMTSREWSQQQQDVVGCARTRTSPATY